MIKKKHYFIAIFMAIFIFCPIFINAEEPQTTLSAFQTQTDELGMKHVRYNQNYNGIPVFGSQQIVHYDVNGAQKSISGKTVADINIDTNPKITENQAQKKALELWGEQFNINQYDNIKSKLYVFNKELVTNKKQDNQNYLVYEVKVFQQKPPAHEYYYIDAHTGELVYQITG
ncbi:MAG: PepSY domain-containing protein, partial [Patescibacteria group bacterium]